VYAQDYARERRKKWTLNAKKSFGAKKVLSSSAYDQKLLGVCN
jgi:hypothetical protein